MISATCKSNSSFPLKPLAAAVLLVFSANVQTAPILDGSLGGNLNIDITVPGTTRITQTANQRDIINWREFSIGSGETVRFVQPDANSVIVNRVNGGIRSDIFGNLVANGRIFLINPSGIVFGANSQVNVNGLVASTLRVRPESLNDETIEFRAVSDSGSILNAGSITAKDIVLLAPSITNTGTLTASGTGAAINLIAARDVTVNTSGSDLVVQAVQGHDNALIEQLGQVMAEGGRIILLARASDDGAPSVINTSGVNRASQISISGDLVQLTGSLNVGNPQGAVQLTAGEVGQVLDGQSEALLVDGSLNIQSTDNINLNNAGNNFTGAVSLTAGGSVNIRDANNLQVSVSTGGAATLHAQNLTINGLSSEQLTANAGGSVQQTGALNVAGNTALTANQITLTNSNNNFDGAVRINSTAGTTIRANGELNISGATATLNVTAGQITQNAALSVSGESTLNASQVTLTNSGNDFVGNVALAVTGSANLNDANNLAVSGSVGAATLTAVNQIQFNELTAASLNVTGASVVQNGALNVQQGTTLNAASVQLDNTANNFGGHVVLNNVGTAVLADEGDLSLSGQVNNLTATAQNTRQSAQAGALTVNNTATFNGGNVELLQAGNEFGGEVVLNLDGQVQLGSSGGIVVSGRAASAVFEVASISQGDTATDALNISGQTRIRSNTVDLVNAANTFGSNVVLQNAGTVNLNGGNTLTVQGSADAVTLTGGNSGQIVFSGLETRTLNASAASIAQTSALNVNETTTLNARSIDLGGSSDNQFGGLVTLSSTESAAVTAQGTLTVTGNVASGNFQADSLVFNGLSASNNLVMTAGNITQSANTNQALRVQGETRINNSGAVTLNNTMNDFNGTVVLGTQGSVRLSDSNTLVLQGQAGSLHMTAQTITQNDSLLVAGATTLNAGTVTLNDQANDFQGQVNLLGNAVVSLHDANTLNVAGNAQQLQVNAGAVEINNALNVNNSLTLITDSATQAASGAAALTVGGSTSIERRNGSSNGVVRLNNLNNNFASPVTLNNQANVQLADRDTLILQGTAGSLSATATEINQLGSLTVTNQATLDANTVRLTNAANDFQGRVSLNVDGHAQVVDANGLRVAGNVNTANFQSGTMVIEGLSALGNVQFNAGSVTQTGALSVGGSSTLSGGSVTLQNAANTFADSVNLNLTGAAAITASGELEVTGSAASADLRANSLNISSLAAANIALQADQLNLNNFTAQGDLTLSGGNVVQQGALLVSGTTTLRASNVILQNEANNFQGNVVLESAGNVNLRDQQAIALQGSAGSLTVQAGTEINQSGALNISGPSNLTAPTINVNNTTNRFGGEVVINATQQATVNASGDLSVGGNAAILNATAQNELSLSNSVLGQLNATAQQIVQTGTVSVTGPTTLTAQSVNLLDNANDFNGPVALDVAGQAR